MDRIFLSHSSRNNKIANVIKDHLENFDIWSMSDIPMGADYQKTIDENIENSVGAILLLSDHFFNSDNCIKEMEIILQKNDQFKVYPLLLSKCTEEQLENFKNIQMLPSTSRSLEEMPSDEFTLQMKKLKRNIKHNLEVRILHNPLWNNIEEFIENNTVQPFPLRGVRECKVLTGKGNFSLHIPINDDDSNLELKAKAFNTLIEDDYFILEASQKSLFRSIYSLFEIIDDKFTETDGTLKEVINQSIKEWREVGRFFRTYGEIERGLLGELWFLNYMIDVKDESMVHSWRGPENDRHDFRINNKEFEVKTTKNSKREHVISSIEQLEPSQDSLLYLISIQLSPSPNSPTSLSVKKLSAEILSKVQNKDCIDVFKTRVEQYVGDSFNVVDKMDSEFVFSTENDPLYFCVDENFPKFKRNEYEQLLYSDNISDISYKLNLHSLNTGKQCVSDEFKKLL